MAEVDAAAHAAKSGSSEAVNSYVDHVFGQSIAAGAAPTIKDRVRRAEQSYRSGHNDAVHEKDVVSGINEAVAETGLPDYARTSGAQLHAFRDFLGRMAPNVRDRGAPSTDMTPAETVFVVVNLGHQKLVNPEYQVDPDEWVQQVSKRRADLNAGRQAASAPNAPGLSAIPAPPTTVAAMARLRDQLPVENSSLVTATHRLLDRFGFQR